MIMVMLFIKHLSMVIIFFIQAEDGIRYGHVTGVQTCALPISSVGKWMIAAGMRLLGPDTPWGWRISAAVIGTLSVLLLVRIGRRLFGSNLLGCTAGLLLAVDGVHISLSRISILDIFVQFWVLAGFAALLLDREQYRRRLAARAAAELATHGRY